MQVSLFGLLAVLFIGLKLAGVGAIATWSWLWVLSPLWLPLVAGILIFVFIVLPIMALRAVTR